MGLSSVYGRAGGAGRGSRRGKQVTDTRAGGWRSETLHKHGSQRPPAAAGRAPAAALQGWSRPPAQLGWAAPRSGCRGVGPVWLHLAVPACKLNARLLNPRACPPLPGCHAGRPCQQQTALPPMPPDLRGAQRQQGDHNAAHAPQQQRAAAPRVHGRHCQRCTGGRPVGHCSWDGQSRVTQAGVYSGLAKLAAFSSESSSEKPTCHDQFEEAKDQRDAGGFLCA